MENNNIVIKQLKDGDIQVGVINFDDSGIASQRENVRLLLSKMLGGKVEIAHNEDGKPLMQGYNVSISHTKEWAAVIVSHSYNVGIDIEYPSNRVTRIAKRFLREDEAIDNVDDILEAWCAKESMFKLCSSQHLSFSEMKVDVRNNMIDNLRDGTTCLYYCERTPDYTLTYLWE